MSTQILSFLAANYIIIGAALLVNIAFFLLGFRYAVASRQGATEERVAAAYKDGFSAARKQDLQDRQGFSKDVTSELSKLRDGIINSAKAYRDTLTIIENRVGFSSEDKERLLIGKVVAADPTISMLDAPLQYDADFREELEDSIPAAKVAAN